MPLLSCKSPAQIELAQLSRLFLTKLYKDLRSFLNHMATKNMHPGTSVQFQIYLPTRSRAYIRDVTLYPDV